MQAVDECERVILLDCVCAHRGVMEVVRFAVGTICYVLLSVAFGVRSLAVGSKVCMVEVLYTKCRDGFVDESIEGAEVSLRILV